MMSFRPGGTDYGPTGQAAGGEGGLDSQWNGVDEHEVVVKERVACDRCRQRKAEAQCTFRLAHKAKEKRQRVLISSVYERRLEHISNRIEELYGIIGQLRDERHNGDSSLMAPTRLRAPSYSSLQSGSLRASPKAPAPAEGIESALFAHVICAARALETAVMNDPYSRAVDDITSALNTLRSTVNDQKQQNETLEGSRSFLKALPSGLSLRDLPIPSSLRDLPIPSMDKIMACLRITQESSPSEIYWPFEFGFLGDFTQYVIRACTPGPISDMELIIVHYVLYSLFTQCSVGADDETLRQDYDVQAATCRESLETILSSLSFHIDTNIDSICALYMASLHCLHRGKVSTAWTFISRASLMCLALGLHSSHAMVTEQENAVQRKMCLFWAVYALEKAVALRLGRPSTIRDQDITIPRLTLDRKMTSLAYNRLPDWIDVASLYGRLYDSLYSPTALTQPSSVRVSRTSALASELERMIAARTGYYNRPDLWSSHVLDLNLSRFMIHANRAIEYSTLASIYRGIPTESPSGIIPCTQCITAARVALEESEASIAILSDAAKWPTGLHEWINEILLLAPFIPLTILVCNVVDTADASDLGRLKGVVDGLQSLAQSPRYASCNRQLRIFKPLYDVAARYVEAKTSRESTDTISSLFTNPDTDVYFDDDTWFTLFDLAKGFILHRRHVICQGHSENTVRYTAHKCTALCPSKAARTGLNAALQILEYQELVQFEAKDAQRITEKFWKAFWEAIGLPLLSL
ncbi:putative C6 transcription factor [Aspergillus thermomutatus]|uniref:Xylanolytic transcriptional activator regulatory domain-containing protein n=1 Tax=Aspergillus thermomutatus TaxID=41047 RepID=A0A397FXN1_ASPTH|nr:uncharacterized protein CDV56_101117 [Aspergillus thermomutatus]RHZ43307.1 hypothetical protein CDV56_101117 [Aspergillus thermomutatus]